MLSTFALRTLLVVSQAQPTPADVAIDHAVSAYAQVKTARATFEQSITNPLVGRTIRSTGEFLQQRPTRFAFRFSDPKGDLILSDGTNVWAYLPSSAPGQVIKVPLESGGAGSLDLIAEFFSSPRTRYVIADGGAATIGGRAARAVKLVPKAKGGSVTKATVWIDDKDGTLRQFEADETSGITRRVVVTSFTANVPVAASVFRFDKPRGVKVVTQQDIGLR